MAITQCPQAGPAGAGRKTGVLCTRRGGGGAAVGTVSQGRGCTHVQAASGPPDREAQGALLLDGPEDLGEARGRQRPETRLTGRQTPPLGGGGRPQVLLGLRPRPGHKVVQARPPVLLPTQHGAGGKPRCTGAITQRPGPGRTSSRWERWGLTWYRG